MVSDLRLVAEAVGAAIADGGIEVTLVDWLPLDASGPLATEPRADVLVLVCQVADRATIEEFRALITVYDGPALVVAAGRPGPRWGALFEAGADVVVPPLTPIRELVDGVTALARGEDLGSVVEKQSLLRQWYADRADVQFLRDRLARLTPREREVLEYLHRGVAADEVATGLGVSQATVRSQIQGILGKLQVRSQLGAVAALEAVLDHDRPDPAESG